MIIFELIVIQTILDQGFSETRASLRDKTLLVSSGGTHWLNILEPKHKHASQEAGTPPY